MNQTAATGRRSAMPPPSDRAAAVRRPGWRATEAQLSELRHHGVDVLEIYGMPVRRLPGHVVEAIRGIQGQVLVPPPSRGLPVLREAIAAKLAAENGLIADPDREVIVTNGAMQAVNVIFRTLLNPGDEVLVPSPSFFFYGMIELAGGATVYARMPEAAAWAWDTDAIAAAITKRTKLIILCNPVNPTGHIVPEEIIRAICHLARKQGIYVLADESYDRMVYDRIPFTSAAALHEYRDVLILVQSITKSYAMSAWRIGYIVADTVLSDSFAKILEWEILYGNEICQRAAAAAISGPQEWLSDIAAEFEGYRDEVWPVLNATPGLSAVKPAATPYFLLNVTRLGATGDDFAAALVGEYGVPATSGSHFDAPGHVRIGFGASKQSTRQALCHRVAQAAAQWPARPGT
jgi:aspartate/methionine/tyrosine aminotransferase